MVACGVVKSVVAAQAGIFTYGCLDAFASELAGRQLGLALLATLGVALAAGALAGMLERQVLHGLDSHALGQRLIGSPVVLVVVLAALAGGASGAGFLAYGLKHFHDLRLILICTAGFAGAGFVAAILLLSVLRNLLHLPAVEKLRGSSRLPVMVLVGLGALVAKYGLSAAAVDGVDADAHAAGMSICFRLLVAILVWLAFRWPRAVPLRPRLRRVYIGLSLAGIGLLVPASASPVVLDQLEAQHGLLPRVEETLRPLLDLDGDGAPALLGLGDCAPFDSKRSPFAVEIPDNGIDEDCRFGDLKSVPRAALVHGKPMQRLLLITVTGLSMDRRGKLHPPLPRLQSRLAKATRFVRTVPTVGAFRHQAPILASGRLPDTLHPDNSGFLPGGPNIPFLVDRAGGISGMITVGGVLSRKLNSILRPGRTHVKKTAAEVVKLLETGMKYRSSRVFLWLHLDAKHLRDSAAEAALAKALDTLDNKSAALLVGVATQLEPGRRSGPLALFGVTPPAAVDAHVGLFDVYPTVIDLLALDAPLEGWPQRPVGDSLRALTSGKVRGRPGALGARLEGERRRVYARGPQGSVTLDAESGATTASDRARPKDPTDAKRPRRAGDLAALRRLVRDRVLAPTLARQNAHREQSAPPANARAVAEFAHGLRVLGCSAKPAAAGHALVTVFLEGGEFLRPTDLLSIDLRPATGLVLSREIPLRGGLPFGRRWATRGVVAHTILFDLRPLKDERAFPVWGDVFRDGKPLPATRGAWFVKRRARICDVQL